jgi:hypothetical protein
MTSNAGLSRKWLEIGGAVFLVLAGSISYFAWRARDLDDFARKWVLRELSERFQSEVELGSVRVTLFPLVRVTGENLVIHFHDRMDVPPLVRVDKFQFHIGLLGFLRAPEHIQSASLQRMTVSIPPRALNKSKDQLASTNMKKALPAFVLDELVCDDVDLVILPKNPKKEPLDWVIHRLIVRYASIDKPFSFRGTLTNAKPIGEIATNGSYGPWDLDDPGSTPVSGTYKFTNADLGPFPGIAGVLTSTGKFSGELDELQTEGKTDMPDFLLDKVGKPVPLHTEFSATVDGTNGDTFLHPVRATLVRSLIVAEGSITNVPGQGHNISLDVGAPNARIQDLLALAINSDKPMMTGAAKFKAKLVLPPGKEKALEKLLLDGQFGVDDAKWTSPEIREQLESLSRHGEGKPSDEDAGSSVSDLHGAFHLEKGVIHFSSLTFSVSGAVIDLAGTYDIRGGGLDFNGHLRLQAKLSQTVTGAKSFFLKAFDPFFKKEGAGAVLSISITGTRDKPTFGVSVFHKTIKKQTGDAGKKPEDGKKQDADKPPSTKPN